MMAFSPAQALLIEEADGTTTIPIGVTVEAVNFVDKENNKWSVNADSKGLWTDSKLRLNNGLNILGPFTLGASNAQNKILVTDASGNATWGNAPAGTFSLVNDLNPKLGADLDLGAYALKSAGDIKISPGADFSVKNDLFYVNGTTSLIGIGTKNPQYELDLPSGRVRTRFLQVDWSMTVLGTGLHIKEGNINASDSSIYAAELNASRGLKAGFGTINGLFNIVKLDPKTKAVIGLTTIEGGDLKTATLNATDIQTKSLSVSDNFSISSLTTNGTILIKEPKSNGLIKTTINGKELVANTIRATDIRVLSSIESQGTINAGLLIADKLRFGRRSW
jgi:hypothetical protein